MPRKKYEFRPDKVKPNLLNKLYMTNKQRVSLLRWSLYALLLLILSVLQDVVLCRMRIFGATTDLIPAAIFLICILLGSETGCVFSLAAACFYQFSGSSPGYFVIVMIPVLSIGAAIFRQTYLQKGFSAAMLCAGLALLVYELLLFVIILLMSLITPDRIIIFALTGAITLLALPILYPIVLSIEKIGGETWKE